MNSNIEHKPITLSSKSRLKFLYIPAGFWILLILSTLIWNIKAIDSSFNDLMQDRGDAIFKMLLLSRLWNAGHEGVYVPISNSVSPNPFLDDPLRDLTTEQGINLTMINPSYMTRQMSEIVNSREGITFHLTSLNPIRLANMADKWEESALNDFEAGLDWKFELLDISGKKAYRYMAPLFVEKSCLKCHLKQGYKEGDIRGGISIIFPAQKTLAARNSNRNSMSLFHAVIFLAGLLAINMIYRITKVADNTLLMLSIQDGLTGIANRRHFNHVLDKEWRRSKRKSSSLSIIMADIDYFKQYNDLYGHLIGDDCIVMVTNTMSKELKRPGDLLARYGGEEFVVMLPDTDFDAALSMAESMRESIESQRRSHDSSIISKYITISMGVASIIPAIGSTTTAFGLVNDADKALYKAKHNGRNRVEAADIVT